MKLLVFLFLLSISYTARADFLIVNRTGNLRETPSSSASILEKVAEGDTLILLRDDQVAGYYYVQTTQTGVKGWIYRTLVSRIAGEAVESFIAETTGLVEVRVIDVGAGLCNIIKIPKNKYVLYDAGGEFDNSGNRTLEQIKEQIPAGSTIELFVLSHTDADHIVAAWQVVRDYKVKKILWTGFERSMVGNEAPTQAYQKLVDALGNHPFTENINLNERDSIIIPEIKMQIGSASFSFLCGFGAPLPEWSLDKSEKLNAVSIVMKLQFGGNSVLFTGDAVGRHRDDPEDALIATEKYLVENASSALPSTIIIAPHHGARNGSSTAFVELVKPEVVIFSAGHKFNHPDERTANKYLQFTSVSNIFRTDRGDDEEGTEWDMGRVHNCNDKRGDDDVHIQLRSNHSYRVFYVVPQAGCSN